MQEAIEECYDRLGRYLDPDITSVPIIMGGGNKYRPYQGQCARTDLEAQVVDHKKSDGSIVATHTKLLWMVGYQNRINKSDNISKRYRLLGCIAFLPNRILTTIELTNRVPNLTVAETARDIIRQAVHEERYLFLCFGQNIDRIFGNDLRYSCGANLEISGEAKSTGLGDITNQAIDLEIPLRLTRMNVDLDKLRRYVTLRNRQVRGVLTEKKDQDEMRDIKRSFCDPARMVRLSRQVTQQDLGLAKWLSQ